MYHLPALNYAITHPTDESLSVLDHELAPFLPELLHFSSTKEMKASELYSRIGPEIERVLGSVAQEDFSDLATRSHTASGPWLRATAWNIERGIRLPSIIDVLGQHPLIGESDVLLLTELDYGMARSGNLFVAREIAQALGLSYVFAPCYLALTKGSGIEADMEGENTLALHGNAILSRFPLLRAHSVALPNGKDKMRGKEKRLGCQRAVVADLEHPRLGMVRVVSLHLDAHSTQRHRHLQMKIMLDHLDGLEPRMPVLIGGDWNTTTYNSKRAVYAILGFWRRVMMGPIYFIRNHYPYPDRWFERHLFRELETRGWTYSDLNEPGGCTLHYDVEDMAVNKNMADWVPRWCFYFLKRALESNNGRASLKLDWFAGKDVRVVPDHQPKVIADLADAEGRLSDHDAIVVDVLPG
ncbi:MAG TPA: endonuclease/exonuclease/phosphatase family protein [Pyrinomonadaceae bacterium]|jgi:endonuclease/exonuclease/phosphatase family metal-dependent hydrolase